MNALWRDEDLQPRFVALTELLRQSQSFWRHHAFKYLQLPWERDFPQLAAHLRGLSLAASERISDDDTALCAFASEHLPFAAAIESVCKLGNFHQLPVSVGEAFAVPGRKWEQIQAFAQCVPSNALSIMEWCSGKAHLGRWLANQRGCSVIALERDAELIEAGRDLAARAHANVNFLQIDVMTAQALHALNANQNAVALHACGDLHVQLLRCGTQRRVHSVTLAPCCYQLVSDDAHYALSQAAKNSGLQLQRDDLRTAVHGSVTAPLRERQKRQQLQAWRLGFDLLQRELRGADSYLPTPALSTAVLKKSFADFCEKLANHKQLRLPAGIDYSHYERAGSERFCLATALDLPRIAHRRALELWLALDRALFLRECGYTVTVGQFCERATTPRNILIRAENRLH